MVDDEEWEWVIDACRAPTSITCSIGTSLPVFVPVGLHDLQVWSERDLRRRVGPPGPQVRRVAPRQGRHGGLGGVRPLVRRLRRLLGDIGSASDGRTRPATISVLSGDIHFSFAAEIQFPASGRRSASRVHQLVSSPIRNALDAARRARRCVSARRGSPRSSAASCAASAVGERPQMSWQIDVGPVFANCLGQIVVRRRAAHAASCRRDLTTTTSDQRSTK